MPLSYQAQNDDEAVRRVEAGPAQRHLHRSNVAAAFDLQYPLFTILVGHNMIEA